MPPVKSRAVYGCCASNGAFFSTACAYIPSLGYKLPNRCLNSLFPLLERHGSRYIAENV